MQLPLSIISGRGDCRFAMSVQSRLAAINSLDPHVNGCFAENLARVYERHRRWGFCRHRPRNVGRTCGGLDWAERLLVGFVNEPNRSFEDGRNESPSDRMGAPGQPAQFGDGSCQWVNCFYCTGLTRAVVKRKASRVSSQPSKGVIPVDFAEVWRSNYSSTVT